MKSGEMNFNRPKTLDSFVAEKGSGSKGQTSYDSLRGVRGQIISKRGCIYGLLVPVKCSIQNSRFIATRFVRFARFTVTISLQSGAFGLSPIRTVTSCKTTSLLLTFLVRQWTIIIETPSLKCSSRNLSKPRRMKI